MFVCLGNIVRSPLAEHLFRHHAEERGVAERYEVDSAGTSDWHVGEPPDPRILNTAAQRGFRYTHRARHIHRQDLDRYDLILAMDRKNYDELLAKAHSPQVEAKIHLLREYDPHGGARQSVPDPYYGGADGFEEVYDIIERSVKGLLEHLEKRLGN